MIWNAKNGSVPVGNTEMYYVSFGHGDKNFVILPGLSDGLATVKDKALLLAAPYRHYFEKYTVYMFSRKNDMPEGYSIRDMAEDQVKVMQALGMEQADVMGVSQGGMIAQYIAIDHPEMVEKLVLAVTAPCVNEKISANVSGWIEKASQGDHKSLMIDTAEKSYSEVYLKKYRKYYPVIGRIGKPKSYDRFLRNAEAILAYDASQEINKISCPTLIIGGEADQIVGAEASYEMHRKIAKSHLHMYEKLGHAAYEEAKDFNERVFGFLEK